MKKYDVIIIGSGIAGISASIYLKRSNKSVLIIESNVVGGQLNRSSIIENYPGYTSIDGPSLAYNLYNQVNNLGIEYLYEEVTSVDFNKNIVNTSNNNIEYKYLIIATGRSPRKLDILNDYVGKGVSYCALCDGNLYKNKDVMVIGGGDVAFEEALYLSNIVNSVIILNRSNHLRAEQKEQIKVKETKNIKVINNEEINNISYNDDKFNINNKYIVDGIFVCIGYVPNSKIFDLKKENDYILVDNHFKTNINNVYAVGDVIKKDIYQLVSASYDGVSAAVAIINKDQK